MPGIRKKQVRCSRFSEIFSVLMFVSFPLEGGTANQKNLCAQLSFRATFQEEDRGCLKKLEY
jgi:hypothetical protein